MKWRAAVRALDDWMLTDIGLGCREIESAIYDSDPGNALLWHASASTDARHFSIAPDPDLINDRSGSDASKAIGRIVGACQDCAKTGRKFDALVRVVKCQEPTTTCLFDHLVGVGEQGRGHGEQFFTTSSSLAPRSHRRRYSIPTDPPRASLQRSVGLLDRGDEDFRARLEIAIVALHVSHAPPLRGIVGPRLRPARTPFGLSHARPLARRVGAQHPGGGGVALLGHVPRVARGRAP